jgi:plasmid stabilization system protein ParE
MSYTIELHPKAVLEIDESYQWYEERSEGLGDRFIDAINKKLNQISVQPEIYSKKKGNLRETKVDTFPFTIIYEVLPKQKIILVTYVFHSKRNPTLKYRR